MKVRKSDGSFEEYSSEKVKKGIREAYVIAGEKKENPVINETVDAVTERIFEGVSSQEIRRFVEEELAKRNFNAAKAYILNWAKRESICEFVRSKENFIEKYKSSQNNADATIDDNSNATGKNVSLLNAEIHKDTNIQISRAMIEHKLQKLYPTFNSRNYVKDLENHIIYKHDESSFAGPIAPYCVSISMYPFILNGTKIIGGTSDAPKNLAGYCGSFNNLLFAISSQYAGAVATSEFLLFFDWFARKEWGDDYYLYADDVISCGRAKRTKTIRSEIEQHFQGVIYSVNSPASARNSQSPFLNFSYFDKPFFEAMFENFYFPDGTQPQWESLNWLQKEFMKWFNAERLKKVLTFPVESFALIYKDGKFVDEENARFVAEELARGHSFFIYISETADSLSSCCRLRNKVQTKEFSFTNGNIGVETGSKSVITLNLSRITQDFCKKEFGARPRFIDFTEENKANYRAYFTKILSRVYKYHTAYNEYLWDMYDAGLLPVYKAGFIDLNKQYLTVGINGLNQAAEFLGLECTNNRDYKNYCEFLFEIFEDENAKHRTKKTNFNVEFVPAESLAVKNYNWDKEDGYWVPDDTNLYASYVFKPNKNDSVLDRLYMMSAHFAMDKMSGGAAAHINLDSHLSVEQYWKLLNYCGEIGCSYHTYNVPNSECQDCGFIAKQPFTKCPKCGSEHINYYDRIIGYLTKISNWSEGRRIEQKTRVYSKIEE